MLEITNLNDFPGNELRYIMVSNARLGVFPGRELIRPEIAKIAMILRMHRLLAGRGNCAPGFAVQR